jgi:hypothetical protein
MDEGDTPTRNPTRMLCIAQYWRVKRLDVDIKPIRWALFALWNGNAQSWSHARASDELDHWGTCYQITGNQVTYAYSRTTDECMEILWDDYRGCLLLGEVKEENIEAMEKVLEKVPVHRHRSDWNCTDWVLAALDILKAEEYITKDIASDWVRREMEDLFRNWGTSDGILSNESDIQ